MTPQPHHKNYTPFLLPLLTVIIGIYAQECLNVGPCWIIGSMGITATGILLCWRLKAHHGMHWLMLGLLFFCGALGLWLQKKEQAILIAPVANQKIIIIGTIIDKNEWGQTLENHVVLIRAQELFFPYSNKHYHQSCDFLCYLKYKTDYTVGDTVILKNVIIKPPRTTSPTGNPTYDDHLLKEHIISALFIPSQYQLRRIDHPTWSVQRWFWNFRDTAYRTLNTKLDPTTMKYVGLIFLGKKQQRDVDQLRTTFNYWGLAHFLARAGLHIVLFIIIWTFMLRCIPVHIFYKKVFLLLLCVIYDFVSWTSVPFARAYYSFLFMKGGELFGKQTNSLHILTLMCVTILLFNPMQLFFLDFQLSFGLTLALIMFSYLVASHKQAPEKRVARSQ